MTRLMRLLWCHHYHLGGVCQYQCIAVVELPLGGSDTKIISFQNIPLKWYWQWLMYVCNINVLLVQIHGRELLLSCPIFLGLYFKLDWQCKILIIYFFFFIYPISGGQTWSSWERDGFKLYTMVALIPINAVMTRFVCMYVWLVMKPTFRGLRGHFFLQVVV